MRKRLFALLICLFAAGAAQAQMGGGGGGGHGRGGGGGGGRRPPTSQPSASGSSATAAAPKPVSEVEIVGVIKAIDTQTSQLTIAYEPVDALNWPAGTMPFIVSKAALLNGASVGQKVRFSLDSGQIATLQPF